jgi:hypothetical protein
MRADSGFYAHAVVAVCRTMDVRFSITLRQSPATRRLIEAIAEAAWTPVPYWLDGGADVAETTYTPFNGENDAVPVRQIARRVKPTPGSQLALFTAYDYHAFITDRAGETLALEADHRRHAEIENAIRELKYGMGLNHLPSGKFAANAAWSRSRCWPTTSPAGPAGWSGCRHRHGQDPPPEADWPRRAAHPLGPPDHPPPPSRLALG